MLDQEDLKWIAAASAELNATLQQITRFSDLALEHKGDLNYLEMLGERVKIASQSAQALFDRVTSKIPAEPAGKTDSSPDPTRAQSFTVVPPPASGSSPSTKAKSPAAGRKSAEPKGAKGSAAGAAKSKATSSPSGPELKILNPSGKRELILLVDDEAEIAELASEMLSEEDYKVIVARDGFDALKIYQQIGKRIGLVILDFFLPVMDGDAVFDELRVLNPQVNVVLSSGFAEQHKIGTMLSQGLRGFIPKPYTREKLLEQVRSTLDAARQGSR